MARFSGWAFVIALWTLAHPILAAGPVEEPAAPAPHPSATRGAPRFESETFDDLDKFHQIAFVCDASGSMIHNIDPLKDQLSKAIASLSADQSFNVIFYHNGSVESAAKELLRATTANKAKAAELLKDQTASGSCDPIPGILEAFREKPDVIYLVTNGDFPDNDLVAKKMGDLNDGKRAKIYPIAFVRSDDSDQDFLDVFKKLADKSDGKFKRVNIVKLGVPASKSEMFDDLGRFHRIVFASDATGSMINKMASLKDQLDKGINSLSDDQSFNLMFFQDSKVDSSTDKLAPANAANKRKAGLFLEGITSTCTTDPLPTIDEAFREKPDVIYLVTDGDFPDNVAVLRKCRELNKDGQVKIYTIAFCNAADRDTEFLDLLKTLARESGGKFRKVDEEKL